MSTTAEPVLDTLTVEAVAAPRHGLRRDPAIGGSGADHPAGGWTAFRRDDWPGQAIDGPP